MVLGIAYIVGACLCWGPIFALPHLIQGFSSFEIVLGRCLCFGFFSFYMSMKRGFYIFSLSKKIWIVGGGLALIGSLIHYGALIISLQYLNPSIPTLMLGLAPICMASISKMQNKEKHFFIPNLLIITGIFLVNLPYLNKEITISINDYAFGILFSLFALITWILYLLKSSKFLKENPSLTTTNWMNIIGCSTGLLSLCMVFTIPFWIDNPFDRYLTFNQELYFFVGSVMWLGIFSSWLGTYLWNLATLYIPLSLAGQLTILEVVFGLIFLHAIFGKLPTFFESMGILSILSGIIIFFILENKMRDSQSVNL